MAIQIDSDLCTNCNTCVEVCLMDILERGEDKPGVAYPEECWYCGACMMDCPTDAIKLVLPYSMRPVAVRVK